MCVGHGFESQGEWSISTVCGAGGSGLCTVLAHSGKHMDELLERYDNPICRTSPPGCIGWQNRFLGIDSWAP
jgi:hypothetical protein